MITLPNNNSEVINTSRISEYANLRLKQILDEFVFEQNTMAIRTVIEEKIKKLFEEIRTLYLLENKSFQAGDRYINITELGPITIQVETMEQDPTQLNVVLNDAGKFLWNDVINNN